jgi:hypothetical protein
MPLLLLLKPLLMQTLFVMVQELVYVMDQEQAQRQVVDHVHN